MQLHLLFIIVLGIISIVGLTFIVERGLALRWRKVIPADVENAADNTDNEKQIQQLIQACDTHPSPISRLLKSAYTHRNLPREENVDALEIRARHEVTLMERGLVLLEIVVGVAPLLGLVGTIAGLIILFGAVGEDGLAKSNVVAEGIATALQATLMGLLTAIPSLIAWSYYNKKVETLSVEMETICDKFVRRLYRK
jgi:biopolymer transport protein ExbB